MPMSSASLKPTVYTLFLTLTIERSTDNQLLLIMK